MWRIITPHLFDKQEMLRRTCSELVSLPRWEHRGEQMCTAGSLQGLLIRSGHTYIRTHRKRVKARVHSPRAGLYPPAPPKALKPCSDACTLDSVFPWNPSFLHQIIFIILPLPGIHLPSLSFFKPNSFYRSTQTFPSKPQPFSTRALPYPPQGFLSCLFPTLSAVSACEGPQSSGCSSRMSDSHTLTFRQPRGSGFKQSHPLSTFRKAAQSDCYSRHRRSAAVNLHRCFIPSVARRDCFTALQASLPLTFSSNSTKDIMLWCHHPQVNEML